MKKIEAEQLKHNWDKLISIINETFSGERKENVLKMHEYFEDRMILAPASGTAHFHNAHIGGYLEHVLHIISISKRLFVLYKELGAHIDYTEEEVIFAAMHHDLGKVGDLDTDYYVPNDSNWHVQNRGEYFKRGEGLHYMTVTDRACWLLQHFNINVSEKEYIGIRLTAGLYEEANKSYLMSYVPGNKLRTNIPYLLHEADMLASRIEHEHWVHSQDKDKPNNVPRTKVQVKKEKEKVDNLKNKFDELFA